MVGRSIPLASFEVEIGK
ncbi:hypothetical protein LINPERHAP1_LOCUS24976 [Linum perenne]